MLLGTATWREGRVLRRALVGRLVSGRLADLNRLEALRLRKLGEGDPDRLAAVLVPPSLSELLRGGPRAMVRARQTLRYAEKWDRRGTLPDSLAPSPEVAILGPCLPDPAGLRGLDGNLQPGRIRGPGAVLRGSPRPTLPPGAEVRLRGGFDDLVARLGPEALHETVQ